MRRSLLLGFLAAALLAVPAGSASALGVAYVDGNEVWVSSVDGQTKVRLSAGEGDWRAVAQGDGGQVVGVRNEANKNGSFATFAVWQPNGVLSDQGPLQSRTGFQLFQVRRTDVAASGRVAAMELYQPNPGSGSDLQQRIGMFPLDQLGGSISPVDHDCFLPSDGAAGEPSLSQDGRLVAYVDEGGMRVAPVTDFVGLVTDCAPATPTTISATGRSPSLGPIDVAALVPSAPGPPGGPGPGPGPGPGTPTTPTTPKVPPIPTAPTPTVTISLPVKTKAAALAAGVKVTTTVPRAGTVGLSLVVSSKALGLKGKTRSIVVATGSAKAKKAGKLTVKLKAKKAYAKQLKKLKGRKLTLRITFAGKTTTKRLTLK